jgi:hypothetical protein
VRLGARAKGLSWEQIKGIKKLPGNIFLVSSDFGWFILQPGLVSQKDNLNKLLRDRQEKLLSSKDLIGR